MYSLKQAQAISDKLKEIGILAGNIISLCIRAQSDSFFNQGEQAAAQMKKALEELDVLLDSDKEARRYFSKRMEAFSRVMRQYISGSLFSKPLFEKALLSSDEERKKLLELAMNGMKHAQDTAIPSLLAVCYFIIRMDTAAEQGSAKIPLPRNDITEGEVYGPIKQILDEITHQVSRWAKQNRINGKVWVGGSLVDGISPVKGLFQNNEFVAYKPFDYKALSDIDIGIGLDRISYAQEVPANLQIKDKVRPGSMGEKILALSSLSIDKDRIKKEFNHVAARKYVNLIESIEPLTIRKKSLKERGIHLQFFLIDERLPVASDLKVLQRKFIIYDRFSQPRIEEEKATMEQIIRRVLDKELGRGNYDEPLLQMLVGMYSRNSYKEIKDKNVNVLSKEKGIAKKKTQKILREIADEI